jgi:hypothetical protein
MPDLLKEIHSVEMYTEQAAKSQTCTHQCTGRQAQVKTHYAYRLKWHCQGAPVDGHIYTSVSFKLINFDFQIFLLLLRVLILHFTFRCMTC